jgi:hypothetical protein
MDEVNRPHDIDPDVLLGARGRRDEGAHERLREVLAQITAISTKSPDADVEDAHLRRMIELARGATPPGLARALAEVTAFSTKQPSSAVTTAHLQAMTELAREIAGDSGSIRSPIAMATKRPPGERVMAHRRLALGLVPALAAPLCIVGIALAGVTLPSAVRAPFDALGVGLPNQGHRGAVIERASTGGGCASSIAALRHPLRLPGDLCEAGAAKGKRAVHREHAKVVHQPRHQPERAPARQGPGHQAGVALAAVGHPGSPAAASAPAGGEEPAPVAQAPVAQQGPPPGHPTGPSGGGHQGPPPGHGPATPPQTPPQTEPPINHPPVAPVYPGKGCGDKNHVHEREGECAKPPK